MDEKIKVTNKCPICGRPTHKESKYCIFHASAEEKTEEEFKQALQDYVEEIKTKHIKYNFEDFIFLGDIDFKEDFNISVFKNADFSGATFKKIAYFNESTFKGYTGFLNTTFERDAIFRDATFKGNTSFNSANFNGCAIFEKATFEGDAIFLGATFKGDPKFIKATFEGFAFFTEATFEEFAYFIQAIFEQITHFQKARFQKGACFMKAIFEESTFFDETIFQKGADFVEATFEKLAYFEKAIFEQITHFKKTTFKDSFDVEKATFKGRVLFWEATFGRYIWFEGAIFERGANFKKAIFEQDVNFEGVNLTGGFVFEKATFEGNAWFNREIFEQFAMFEGVTFKGDAIFWEATSEGGADLGVKSFVKTLDLEKIIVLSGNKLILRVKNNIEIISLKSAYLENAFLDIELEKSILIDFTDTSLKNTKIKKDQIKNHILQEKKKKFYEAQEIYLLLKNNFHSIGQYGDESWAFTKERDMERMSKSFYALLNKYKKYSLFKKILMRSSVLKRVIIKIKIFEKWLSLKRAVKWFNLSVSDFIYQYGENPWRVIRFAFTIIFSFAIILNLTGIVNSDSTNLIIEFIKENQGDGYTLRYLGSALGSFLNCLYFSVVTFTTLGYGDFQPAVGLSRFFASLESIIGAFTMALFVYTFARRTGGR